MFTIKGNFNTGDEWEEKADTLHELVSALAKIGGNSAIAEYRFLDDGNPTTREDILYNHCDEAEALISNSNDPQATEDMLVCMFGWNPWA